MGELVTVLVILTVATQARRIYRAGVRANDRLARHRHRHDVERRPIEVIAVSVRRLGRRYHYPPLGQRFAKAEGVRRAYDDVLAEACEALELPHLMRVLRPGAELDAERRRVEWVLECAGLDLGLFL